jgi:hypothetical protein
MPSSLSGGRPASSTVISMPVMGNVDNWIVASLKELLADAKGMAAF